MELAVILELESDPEFIVLIVNVDPVSVVK
jgi:hypothetical protein